MLALTMVMLAVLLAPYLRAWLVQRAQIASLQRANDQLSSQVAQLDETRTRWKDPAYVRAQARQRLQYAMPGETSFVVLGAEPSTDDSGTASPRTTPHAAHRAWFGELWSSVQAAGAGAEPSATNP